MNRDLCIGIGLLLLFFLLVVWPTRYVYYTAEGSTGLKFYRRDRLTDTISVWHDHSAKGWYYPQGK